MTVIFSFGEWIKRQRRQLRLTQRELAGQVHCSTATIKKIESDQRRPSPELARLLAEALNLPPEQHATFVDCARGRQPVDALVVEAVQPPHTFHRPAPLPLSATPFVGRADELAAVARQLDDPACRLLTLVGPGGAGKSRLALAAAHVQQRQFSDGAIFVPLAATDRPDGIAPAIAKALNLPLNGPAPAEHQLRRLLHTKEMLLVLDNFEQLVAGAGVLSRLLGHASGLKLLVTSRERLNLAEEWLYPVNGFGPEQAALLFAQTARRLHPQFDATDQQAAIEHICRLVDGLPLAVELAAGWARLMPCDRIAAQIQQNLDFLSTGPRNAPERHRSLRALFDHSWQFLSPAEQQALARLSIFRGGFAPEEAAVVAGATWPILLGLADKSLVTAQANGRYDLHELTRQFAAEKLQSAGQEAAARQLHFDACLALAKKLDARLHGANGISAYARLEQEQDNLRAALRWGLEASPANAVLRLVNHLFFFWLRRGYWREGEQWTVAAVKQAAGADDADLCTALAHGSTLIAIQGRYADAGPYLPRALPMARRLEEKEPLTTVLTTLAQATPDYQEARAVWEEAISLMQSDEVLTWQLAMVYSHYGDGLRRHGDYPQAAARYRQSLALMRQMGNVDMIAYPLGNLGLLALQEGNLDEAHRLIAESVAISQASGNWLGMGDWVLQLGQVLLYLDRTDEAARSLREALAIFEEMDNRRGQASTLASLAHLTLKQQNVEHARTYMARSLTTYRDLRRQMETAAVAVSQAMSTRLTFSADTIDGFIRAGLVLCAGNRFEQAATMFGIVESVLAHSGYQPIQPLQTEMNQAIGTTRRQVAGSVFTAAWAAGQTMSPVQIFSFAVTAINSPYS